MGETLKNDDEPKMGQKESSVTDVNFNQIGNCLLWIEKHLNRSTCEVVEPFSNTSFKLFYKNVKSRLNPISRELSDRRMSDVTICHYFEEKKSEIIYKPYKGYSRKLLC